ncbi:MAG: hypothetical protein HN754_09980 [Opitutae bacterium]|nr:hypothetical protein [Opitutae bacterium]
MRLFICLFSLLLVGCLNFGDDVELVGAEITGKEMIQVSELIGLTFPNGTKSIGYYFMGSGIDDALSIKVSIPEGTKDEFLKNEIFQNGNNSEASIQIGRSRSWWKLDELKDRIDGSSQLPKGRYAECTLGKEEGGWVAYISWMST